NVEGVQHAEEARHNRDGVAELCRPTADAGGTPRQGERAEAAVATPSAPSRSSGPLRCPVRRGEELGVLQSLAHGLLQLDSALVFRQDATIRTDQKRRRDRPELVAETSAHREISGKTVCPDQPVFPDVLPGLCVVLVTGETDQVEPRIGAEGLLDVVER